NGPRASARLALDLVAQLLLLVLDEPADHLPPERLGEIGRHSPVARACAYLVDHLLVAPGHVGLLPRLELELPGPLHIAETLGNQVDERRIDAIDLDANLGHVAALRRGTGGHGGRSHSGVGRLSQGAYKVAADLATAPVLRLAGAGGGRHASGSCCTFPSACSALSRAHSFGPNSASPRAVTVIRRVVIWA